MSRFICWSRPIGLTQLLLPVATTILHLDMIADDYREKMFEILDLLISSIPRFHVVSAVIDRDNINRSDGRVDRIVTD